MEFLFTPRATRDLLVQWSPDDKVGVIAFAGSPGAMQRGTGAPADQARPKAWGFRSSSRS
ncbi:hypothetical protein [Chelatococcus reniformis]|uniref:Uncharacterized protein n=1 Tax=Chelatococcus reniformis TaxID=1494448 RepID=A0A916U9Y8_9HYPH|nr:hypothetical protein [Chelatococcus reniformis]GGC64810.1 hypothetical protein GCM10010994_24240 [Chelatococcus reniformis]